MLRYAIEKSTCAICVSRLSAEKIRCCRSRVILPGINPASIICSEERNSTRQSLGLSLHDFVVGQFVRAHTFKNTEMLISALPEDLVCKILFVGDGPHLKQILSIADKKIPGRFIHVQHNQMHLGKLYSAIDCYACTSISEGCPRVMWESMFSRKPFLTTPVGACVDVIKHGYNGFVFSNCDELKSTILLLKSNSVLRGNIANAAFAMANAHGHIQKTASEIASFIKKEIYYKCLT
jgi:glycosyltransferase involved in cell wall biosynthesis